MTPHGTPPTGVLLVACGEVTQGAVQALRRLQEAGYSAALLDTVSLKGGLFRRPAGYGVPEAL